MARMGLQGLKRAVLGIQAFITLVRDPDQLGKVFELRESLDDPERLAPVLGWLRTQPQAARAFAERPRLGRLDLDALARLPEGTLGQAFAANLRRAGLDPADIPTLAGETDCDYFGAHLYETHDLWHTLTGFETDVAGELGLQAFYLANIRGPLPLVILAGGLLNAALKAPGDKERRMDAIARGWALGKQSRLLFGVRWAEKWSEPLEAVQREFGLVLAPEAQARQAA
jgi:ubiquinone biosynthesis protein Coq4